MLDNLIGWYSTGSYFLAKNLVELPFILLVTICYAVLLYKMTNQIDDNHRMLTYMALIIGILVCGQGLVFLIGVICTTGSTAILTYMGILLNCHPSQRILCASQ